MNPLNPLVMKSHPVRRGPTLGMLVAFAMAALSGQPISAADKLHRIPDTRYELQGVVKDYLDGITENWLLTMPERNPAILQMFADQDKKPYRNLLPWSGEFAGKYLTGATQILRLTHDPKLKSYVAQFVAHLVQLQADDGYLGPFPLADRLDGRPLNCQGGKYGSWDVWGHYHIMLGMLLWYEETGDKSALNCATKIGDLLCHKFLKSNERIADLGSVEQNHAAVHSLCLLYQITKTPPYLELARQIADQEFQDKLSGDYLRVALEGKEFYQGRKPRWESLHAIQGLAELYKITGEESYRKAFEEIWWSIVKTDRHNNGGFSSREQAVGNPYDPAPIETCCTVAWVAMGVDMLRLTGSSIVADELELSTLNQVFGYQNRTGKWCTYNTPMVGRREDSVKEIGFQKRPGSEEVNCCSANAPRGFGIISDWALMTDGQGLVVNWYGPSTLSAKLDGTTVAIQQQTDYPRDGRIALKVSPERSMKFPLKLRIPYWSANTRVQVNGQMVPEVKPGNYLVLDREWKSGDTVDVDLDMSLHYWVGERQCAEQTSIYRGPLLLICETSLPHRNGDWKGDATKTVGGGVETTFEGRTVTWNGRKYDDAGRASVMIDGKEVVVVDQYGPVRGEPFTWTYRNLQPGIHTFKVTVLDEKNPDSKDHWINVSSIEPPAGPLLDAATLHESLVPATGTTAPLLTMEVTDINGKKVRLLDYGTGGEGINYKSWLGVQNVKSTEFSESNPLRSSRPGSVSASK